MIPFGDVPIGAVLPIPFASYAGSTGASITLTGLAVTDIEVYKGTSTTQRASDAGYALMDTDGIDFDGITGIHGFSIDTGDNTDAGFYAAGSYYFVIVSAVTVDGQTVNFIAATFRCVPAETSAGVPQARASAIADGAISTASFAAGAINAAAIADGAIDAATFAANAINASKLDPDVTTELQNGLATAAALALVDDFIDTEIADIQARLPAALTAGGNMKVDVLAISGSTAAADALEESTEAIGYGTVDGTGATTTVFLTSALTPDSAVNDQFNGRVLLFKSDTTTAALRGQGGIISDYAHTSAEIGTFTLTTALTTAPSTGDTFSIL